MALLGKNIKKTSYNTSVWVIIIILACALLFFILQYKNNRVITTRTKSELNKSEEEFNLFKKNAMKKEQEIMRKLQEYEKKESLTLNWAFYNNQDFENMWQKSIQEIKIRRNTSH